MKHWAVVVISLVTLAGGFVAAHLLGACSAPTRAAALVVAGVILFEGWLIISTPSADNMPFWTSQEAHTAARVALVLITLATLIQGFGDVIAGALVSCR